MTNRELAARLRHMAEIEHNAVERDCAPVATVTPVTLEKGVTRRRGRFWVVVDKKFLGEYRYLEHSNIVARTGKANLDWRML
jgi:hypothetical protein